MVGGNEGGGWPDSGAHDDPKLNRRLECGVRQRVQKWGEECYQPFSMWEEKWNIGLS